MGRDLMPSLNKSRYAMMIPGVNLSSSRGSAVMYYHLYSTHTHVPLFIAVRKCISVFLCAGMKANALGVQYTPIRQQHIFQPRLSRARCDAPSHSILSITPSSFHAEEKCHDQQSPGVPYRDQQTINRATPASAAKNEASPPQEPTHRQEREPQHQNWHGR